MAATQFEFEGRFWIIGLIFGGGFVAVPMVKRRAAQRAA
jgi:hypothetical protein